MPNVGDTVIIEGNKVGAQRREGTFLGSTGRLIRVRWDDGSESLISPGAGAVRFLAGNGGGREKRTSPAKGKPTVKPAAGSKAAKKPAAGTKTAKKTAAKKAAKKSR